MKARITKRSVEAMRPGASDEYLWDCDLTGFGVKVTPRGRRTYLIQYRNAEGRTRRVTIGKHGVLTPEEARKAARGFLGQAAQGGDPAEMVSETKKNPTVAEVCDRFLGEYCPGRKKKSSIEEDRRLMVKFIRPALGNRRIDKITRMDIARLHGSMASTPYSANRVLALLSTLFNQAESWGYRVDGTSPCRHVRRYREKARERMLSPKELARLGSALKDHETRAPHVTLLIRLLVLTGCRLSEILRLEWPNVDFEATCLRLPDSKTGAKVVPLNAPALQLLANTPRVEGNPYVVIGGKEGTHLVNPQRTWRAIRSDAGLDDVRIHDLRHAFASVGATSGESLVVISALLGHREMATTAKYAHLSDDPVRAASERIGSAIWKSLNDASDHRSPSSLNAPRVQSQSRTRSPLGGHGGET